jgi:hypothetical protein
MATATKQFRAPVTRRTALVAREDLSRDPGISRRLIWATERFRNGKHDIPISAATHR